jgi:hypothetical protein
MHGIPWGPGSTVAPHNECPSMRAETYIAGAALILSGWPYGPGLVLEALLLSHWCGVTGEAAWAQTEIGPERAAGEPRSSSPAGRYRFKRPANQEAKPVRTAAVAGHNNEIGNSVSRVAFA